ncbi:hypothetical protein C2G38_2146215 [Gigaspora rosea]|uniref:Uncharacterized protein n=1 Tax=Gigaspora rosea TaxID=44941 RepID=A0A397ULK3_9GLOM|nr:hypothetical protein C2G38_2146215 [Gigaspora rosea]
MLKKKIVFYTKNGVNLGIACYLPNGLEENLYPCVGFRSQGGSIEVNFGNRKFEYSVMNNKDICDKEYEGILYKFIIGEYDKALEDLTKLLKNDPKNENALRYRGEINYLMKKYNESTDDLNNLLEIKPKYTWASEARKLVVEA